MKMSTEPLEREKIEEYLQIPDLTLDQNHIIGILYGKIVESLQRSNSNSEIRILRPSPIVPVQDNYDRLLIPPDNLSRSSTYTHYVDITHVLRTHTSASIPEILSDLAKDSAWEDVTIVLPGLVYRRDVTDRKHLSVIHQLEVWRIVRNASRGQIARKDLLSYVDEIANTLAKNWQLRIVETQHPYTQGGLEVNLVQQERDIELLECGLIHEQLLINAGLNPTLYSGWASGMGLDRLAMIVKGLPDIRYLRTTNPRIEHQMHDLDPYKEVSLQPAISRDMSYCVPADYVEEDINDDIRVAIDSDIDSLESIEVLNETHYAALPQMIRERLGCQKDQKNVLVRIVLRHLTKTLTRDQANEIYKKVYKKVNYGKGGYE